MEWMQEVDAASGRVRAVLETLTGFVGPLNVVLTRVADAPGEKVVAADYEIVKPMRLSDGRGADAEVSEVREGLPTSEATRRSEEVLQRPVPKRLLHGPLPEEDEEEGHRPEGRQVP